MTRALNTPLLLAFSVLLLIVGAAGGCGVPELPEHLTGTFADEGTTCAEGEVMITDCLTECSVLPKDPITGQPTGSCEAPCDFEFAGGCHQCMSRCHVVPTECYECNKDQPPEACRAPVCGGSLCEAQRTFFCAPY